MREIANRRPEVGLLALSKNLKQYRDKNPRQKESSISNSVGPKEDHSGKLREAGGAPDVDDQSGCQK
jgi:hypothetical protein